MNANCACGAVAFTTPTAKPLNLYHCHCTHCRKQSASAFGTSAIFPYFSVADNPNVSFFTRTCDSGRQQKCYFCNRCGSRIIHEYIVEEGHPEFVVVKGGLLEGLDWSNAKHIFARSAVVPIPGGAEVWDAEPGFDISK